MAASPFQKPGRRHNRLRTECIPSHEPPQLPVFFSIFSLPDNSAEVFEGFTDDDIINVELSMTKATSALHSSVGSFAGPENTVAGEANELTAESYSFLDVNSDNDKEHESYSLSIADIPSIATKSRVVKASQKLREAVEADMLFPTSNSNKRSSKLPKTISAILSATSGASDLINSSNESVGDECLPGLSKHDREMLEKGEAIDLSRPSAPSSVENTPKIKSEASPSPRSSRSSFKRAKPVRSLADTTTKDSASEVASDSQDVGSTSKLDLSENVISSTSNDTPSHLRDSASKRNVRELNEGENEDVVSSSNLPDIITDADVKSESYHSPPVVSVDTARTRSEIVRELFRLKITEQNFIRTVLKVNDIHAFQPLLGSPKDFNSCSEQVKRHYIEMGMWLSLSNEQKMKIFKTKAKSAAINHRITCKKTLLRYKKAAQNRKAVKEEISKWQEASDKYQDQPIPNEYCSEVFDSSKRMTRARLFGSPAKAAEERKSFHMSELYREKHNKKLPLNFTSATALIGQKLAKSMKKKSKTFDVGVANRDAAKKPEAAQLAIFDREVSVLVNAEENECAQIELESEKISETSKRKYKSSWSAKSTSESLDRFLSTSPVASTEQAQMICGDGTFNYDVKSPSKANNALGSRTKHVSRDDALVIASDKIRIPKLRLSAVQDKSVLSIERELPADEDEEFTPGKNSSPMPSQPVNQCLSYNDCSEDESAKKRKRSSKTPIDAERSTCSGKGKSVAKTAPEDSVSGKRRNVEKVEKQRLTSKEKVDLRLADEEMIQWVSRITVGGIGDMLDHMDMSELERDYVFSDLAKKCFDERCGLCDCCAMDLQCNECAQCVNGPNDKLPKCPFKQCLLHDVIKYLRGEESIGMNILELTRLWVRNRKTEQLVHNILFLRKFITSMAENMSVSEHKRAKLDRSSRAAIQTQNSGDRKDKKLVGTKTRPRLSSGNDKPQQAPSGNIFALLGQKLASSRKRPNSSVQQSIESQDKSTREGSKLEAIVAAPPAKVAAVEKCDVSKNAESQPMLPIFVALNDFDASSGPSSTLSEEEMIFVDLAQVEVGTLSSNDNNHVFVPPVGVTEYQKTCTNGRSARPGQTSGRMTLRSSSDSILHMGLTGLDQVQSPAGGGGGSSGDGLPPDSPDEKYWSFAAAAASLSCDKSGLIVSVEIPDFHYTDRMYLHKHGLPIIGTCGLPVASVCLICSSAGLDPLLYCAVCCDAFHVFCIDRKYRPVSVDSRAWNWVCRSCFACRVCGQGTQLVECFVCQAHYHLSCLPEDFSSRRHHVTSSWRCPQCAKCEACFGVPETQIELNGVSHSLCRPCYRKIQHGQYCQLCLQVFPQPLFSLGGSLEEEEDVMASSSSDCEDMATMMHADQVPSTPLRDQLNPNFEYIKCTSCLKWTHKHCENLTEEHCELIKMILNRSSKASSAADLKDDENASTCSSSANTDPNTNYNQNTDPASLPKNVRFNFCCFHCSKQKTGPTWLDKVHFFLKGGIKTVLSNLIKNANGRHLVHVKLSTDRHDLALNLNNSRVNQQEKSQDEPQSKMIGLKYLIPVLKSGSYKSVTEFHEAIMEIVEHSVELQPTHVFATEDFCKVYRAEMKSAFPFFPCPLIDVIKMKTKLNKKKFTAGNILNCIGNQLTNFINSEHNYCLNGDAPKEFVTEPLGTTTNRLDENDKLATVDSGNELSKGSRDDRRPCQLCMSKGDRPDKLEGRLLYCGQDEWVHVNCALWSSEVHECAEGSACLRFVFAAITRGKSMRCDFCKEHGATVGCAASHCAVQCHFTCARQTNFVFLSNGHTYCSQHKHIPSPLLDVIRDFRVRRRVHVDLEEIRWKKRGNNEATSAATNRNSATTNHNQNSAANGVNGADLMAMTSKEDHSQQVLSSSSALSNARLSVSEVRLQIGSLRVDNVCGSGSCNPLSSLSDTPSAIIPISYQATRLYWSTEDPMTRTLYHLRVSESTVKQSPESKHMTVSSSDTNINSRSLSANLPVRLLTKRRRRSQSHTWIARLSLQSEEVKTDDWELEDMMEPYTCPASITSSQVSNTSEGTPLNTDVFDPNCFKLFLRNHTLEGFIGKTVSVSQQPGFKRRKVNFFTLNEQFFCSLCGRTLTRLSFKMHYAECSNLASKYSAMFPKNSRRRYSALNGCNFGGESDLARRFVQFVDENVDSDYAEKFVLSMRQIIRTTRTPKLLFTVTSDDGFYMQSNSLQDIWDRIHSLVWIRRVERGMLQKHVASAEGGDALGSSWRVFSQTDNVDSLKISGLSLDSLSFLLEQLPSAKFCSRYKFKFFNLKVQPLHINESGCARCEPREDTRTLIGRRDMFSWLSSRNRRRPECDSQSMVDLEYQFANLDKRKTTCEYPIPMRYRNLKRTAKQVCAVFKSEIHGRGLYSLQAIFPDEMIIEYTGEIIRSIHTDKRERYYESKGIGCYMFRMDDKHVIDATMSGNAARFINHSCQPNCYSRVLLAENRKHIVIFALRHILRGEELTYDYKFDIEDDSSKLQCHCKSSNCRKFLN